QALASAGHIYGPEMAEPCGAVFGPRDAFLGVGNLGSVRRPCRVVTAFAEMPYLRPIDSHNKDSAAVAGRSEGDLPSIGRKRGLGIVIRRVACKIDRFSAADAPRVDIPVSGDLAGVGDRL